MPRRHHLIRAGLNVAAQEGQCQNRHMDYIKLYGYAYCPYCGIRLEIKLRCEHCQHDFTSERSFHVHRHELALYIANPCPNQKGTHHRIKYMRNRNRMYCNECHLEYPVKSILEVDTKLKESA